MTGVGVFAGTLDWRGEDLLRADTPTSIRRRVLFVAPSAYPLGGVATWLDYIVPGLRRRGWDVVVGLTSGRFHDVDAYLDRHPMTGVERIDCNSGTLEARVRSLIHTMNRLRPAIAASVNVPDLYLAVDRLRRRRSEGPRAVMTLHALESDLFQDMRRYADILDALIATNRLALALARQRCGLGEHRTFYAPYGVQTTALPREMSGAPEQPLRVAVVGRLAFDQKRVEDLPAIAVELARRNVSCEWLIAGAGPQEGWLREKLGACCGGGSVRFLGNLKPDELSERVYRKADVLLITSSWETGPIVAWEAMAHGVAVVTSRYVGAGAENSLREGENCLFFPVGDAAEAARRLAEANCPELRRRLVNGAAALVRDRYSYDASVDAWSQCLAAILERPSRESAAAGPRPVHAGRLDRLFGAAVAEDIREIVGRRAPAAGPGDEWPHSHTPWTERDFLTSAAQLDQPGRT